MYFREWLINENTVAQELKKYPKDLIRKIQGYFMLRVLDRNLDTFIKNHGNYGRRVVNKLTEFMIEWLLHWQDNQLNLHAVPRKEVPIKKQIELLKQYFEDEKEQQTANANRGLGIAGVPKPFQDFKREFRGWGILDYLRASFHDENLQQHLMSKLNDPEYDVDKLKLDADNWHEQLADEQGVGSGKGKGRPGRDLGIKVGNYHWVALDRSYCEMEKEAGGHCGNVGYENGDNIISLRDDNNKVYATFIVNGRRLKEAKGRFNKPPDQELHPAIVALLSQQGVRDYKDRMIYPSVYIEIINYEDSYVELARGIRDFQVSDLSPSLRKQLLSEKPHIDESGKKARNNIRNKLPNIRRLWKNASRPNATKWWSDKEHKEMMIRNHMREFYWGVENAMELFNAYGMEKEINEINNVMKSMGFQEFQKGTGDPLDFMERITSQEDWQKFENNLKKYAPWVYEEW